MEPKDHHRGLAAPLRKTKSAVEFVLPKYTTFEHLTEFLHAFHESDTFGEGEEDDRQLSREKLLEKIREKKEVIEKLRCQPWSMRRKLRTLRLAQKYLERHEAKVSKTHLWKEEMSKKWKKFKRWLSNVSIYLIPWEARIKTIESHFGSVVSSYFTFLRWIFWVNFVITLFMMFFIVVPEILADMASDIDKNKDLHMRKRLTYNEVKSATTLQDVWSFEGYIRVSPMFYGFYSKRSAIGAIRYDLRLAYFLVYLFVLAYSFWVILRKMAANARLSKMSAGKTEQFTFGWKIFTGWDYTIGHTETASNTVAANANKFKETITEYKAKEKPRLKLFLIFGRIAANLIIFGMIAASTMAVKEVVDSSVPCDESDAPKSRCLPADAHFLRRNEVPIVVSMITLFFPNFFELVSRLEKYHPRTMLRLHLARILLLYMLNFYTLIFALFTTMEKIKVDYERLNRSAAIVWRHQRSAADSALPGIEFSVDALLNSPLGPNLTALFTQNFNSSQPMSPTSGNGNGYELGLPTPLADLLRQYFQNKTLNDLLLSSAVPLLSSTLSPISNLTLLAALLSGRTTRDAFVPQRGSASTPFSLRASAARATSSPRRRTTSTRSPSSSIGVSIRDFYQVDNVSNKYQLGPLTYTRMHPRYGLIGVENARAYLKENVSEEELKMLPSWEALGGPTRHSLTTPKPPSVVTKPPGRVWSDRQLSSAYRYKGCWETYVGQEICRLLTMDLIMTIAAVFVIDFLRGLWVKYCNTWWCWNIETGFPEYGEFKVAENVLHIVNSQGMIWLGLFFSPLLPAVNNVKLVLMMYIRSWAVVTCNVPARQVFRASRSNNFYYALLLLMLFMCTLPVGYVIASQTPSKDCGPFAEKKRFYSIITDKLVEALPTNAYNLLDHVASPGVVIPILVLLILIIYFLISLTRALKESNTDLKKQLQQERTEEKRKVYAMAEGRTEHSPAVANMPETKKVNSKHLPEKEQKRREPWRQKPALLVEGQPHDKDSDEESSDSSGSVTPPSAGAKPLLPVGPSLAPSPELLRAAGVLGRGYIPSLQSLPEETATTSAGDDESGDEDDEKPIRDRSNKDGKMHLHIAPSDTVETFVDETPTTPTKKIETPQDVRALTTEFPSTERPAPLWTHTQPFPEQISSRPPSTTVSIASPEQPSSYENTPISAPTFTPIDLQRMLSKTPVRSQPSPVAPRSLIEFSGPETDTGGTESELERFVRQRSKAPPPPGHSEVLLQEPMSSSNEDDQQLFRLPPPMPYPLSQQEYRVPSDYNRAFHPWPSAQQIRDGLKSTEKAEPKSILKAPSFSPPRESSRPLLKSSDPEYGNTSASIDKPVLPYNRRPRFKITVERETSPADGGPPKPSSAHSLSSTPLVAETPGGSRGPYNSLQSIFRPESKPIGTALPYTRTKTEPSEFMASQRPPRPDSSSSGGKSPQIRSRCPIDPDAPILAGRQSTPTSSDASDSELYSDFSPRSIHKRAHKRPITANKETTL